MLMMATVQTGEAKPAWQAEWEKTVKAAEVEGKIVVYSNSGLDPVLREAFQKKYPKIKVTTIVARGYQQQQRVLSERRAGKFIPDLILVGSTTPVAIHRAKALDPIKPLLILPEVVDQSNWWRGKHHYVDTEGKHIFMFEGTARSGGINYNTKLVNPDEFKSYWDFFNPKWKGKIVSIDPLVAGPASNAERYFYYHSELGPEFLRRLYSRSDITIVRRDQRLLDWLGVGKYAIGFFARGGDAAEAQGLPLKEFLPGRFKEGSSIGAYNGTVSYFNRAPHPNAAKVLVNWLLSREGQMIWLDYNLKRAAPRYDSMREDIPKDKVLPKARRVEGVNYLVTDRPEWMDMKPIYSVIKKAREEARKKTNR